MQALTEGAEEEELLKLQSKMPLECNCSAIVQLQTLTGGACIRIKARCSEATETGKEGKRSRPWPWPWWSWPWKEARLQNMIISIRCLDL